MQNITIYYGPKSGFQKLLKFEEPVITLTNLAIISDKKMREHLFKMESRKKNDPKENTSLNLERIKIKYLIAFSDEYAALSESAIQGFLSFLSQFDIHSVFLQNPPMSITSQLYNSGYKINVINYAYKQLSQDSLKRIYSQFDQTIIGQQNVKRRLLNALYPVTNKNHKQPVVLLFYGPTGVGKTETAKLLSSLVKESLFRKQFSMFNSEEFASYLFGGKHFQSSLSRELLERESNIILFDEFDKIHPVYYSAFYQIFDEGVYEDKNYSVTLENTVIICTSNFSSIDHIVQCLGAPIYSRFDAIIEYDALSREAMENIASREYSEQYEKLEHWEKKIIEHSNVRETIAQCIGSIENARHLKTLVKEKISEILVENIMRG
jgi:ATP-dependent Clp protease ATP-binding subunit ClpA